MRQRVEILKRKFVQRAGLPFREVLSEASIESALAEEKVRYRNRLYTPIVTIWAFLSQVLESDQSLANTALAGASLVGKCWSRAAFKSNGRLHESSTAVAREAIKTVVISDWQRVRSTGRNREALVWKSSQVARWVKRFNARYPEEPSRIPATQ